MVSEPSIRGSSSAEMMWGRIGGGSWDRRADSSIGGVGGGATRHLLGEMPSHQKAATSGILRITVSHVLYPVTKEVLHQVLEAYGVEGMSVFERVNQVEAMVQLRSWQEAERARNALHGRCIYDHCCFLDVQRVQPTTEPASTKMARSDAVASVCAQEVVVEATCSSPPDKHPASTDEPKSEPLSPPTPGCEWDAMSDEQKRRCLKMVIEVKETLYNRLGWPLSSLASSASSEATAPEDSTDTTAGWDGVDVVPLSQGKEPPLEVLEVVPMKTHSSSDDDKPPLVTAPTTTFVTGMDHNSLVGDGFTLFERIRDKDLISWGSIIAGFAQHGCKMEAVQIFREMIAEGVHHPNEFHFGSVFSACGAVDSMEYGEQIHGVSAKYRLDRNSYAGCSLSDMYNRCKQLESARRVFYGIYAPDLVPWNSIINACSVEGLFGKAMVLFTVMRDYGLRPDGITVRGLLCACVGCDALRHGRLIHSYLVKLGLDGDVSVCNSLVSMYARCMDFPSAMDVFHETKDCDVVTWNNILTACVQHQHLEVDFGALDLSTLHLTLPSSIGNGLQFVSKFLSSKTSDKPDKIKPHHGGSYCKLEVLGSGVELTSLLLKILSVHELQKPWNPGGQDIAIACVRGIKTRANAMGQSSANGYFITLGLVLQYLVDDIMASLYCISSVNQLDRETEANEQKVTCYADVLFLSKMVREETISEHALIDMDGRLTGGGLLLTHWPPPERKRIGTINPLASTQEMLFAISAIVVALLAELEPKIQYTLKAIGGSLTAIPRLFVMIDHTVNSIASDMLQWPHRLVVPLVVNADPSELELKPQVRRLFKVKTKVIDDNLNPGWNETFHLIVEDKETQFVIFVVYDEDKLLQDMKLGVAKLAVNGGTFYSGYEDILEQQKRGNGLVTGIGYIQVMLDMVVLQVPWDPGGVEFFRRVLIPAAWGQAAFRGGRNVTVRPA